MAEKVYRVGDPDPTVNVETECLAAEAGPAPNLCTRARGHPMPHIAGDEGKIVAVWEDSPPSVTPTYEDVWRAISDLRDKSPRNPLDTATDEIVDMLIDRGWLRVAPTEGAR